MENVQKHNVVVKNYIFLNYKIIDWLQIFCTGKIFNNSTSQNMNL